MNVKKVLMVLISLCLVCGMAGAVSANTEMDYTTTDQDPYGFTTTSTGGSSTVLLNTTDIKPGFTLSIPDTIELTKNETDGLYETTAEVTLKNIVYVSQIEIKVDVKSSNTWQLSYNTNQVIPYNMTAVGDNGVEIGTASKNAGDTFENILKVTSADLTDSKNSVTTTLKFKTLTTPTISAEFTDTLTFTVEAKLIEP